MKQVIEISELWVQTIIGIHEFEKTTPQPLGFWLKVGFDASEAIASDAIEHTIDYYSLTQRLIAYVQAHPCALLERLLHRLLAHLAESDARIEWMEMAIKKPEALNDFKAMVQVEGRWQRR